MKLKYLTGLIFCSLIFVMSSMIQSLHFSSRAQSFRYPVIRISTVQQFFDSIGSNRMLLLNSGTFNLSDITFKKNTAHIQWIKDPEQSFIIKDVENLTIAGQGRNKTRIIIEETFAQVLSFENSKKISIQSLELGHEPRSDSVCLGAVFGAFDSQDIVLQNVTLFGSGTFGLWLENVHNVQLKYSHVKDCSQGLLWLYGVNNIQLYKSHFFQNFGGVNIIKSQDIQFEGCRIVDNNALESPNYTNYLFSLKQVKNFTVNDTELVNNVARGLIEGKADGKFEMNLKAVNNHYE